MAITAGPLSGIRSSLPSGANIAGLRDGPYNWYVPTAAEHFTALALAVPDFLYTCDDFDSGLTNSIGAATPLLASGTGHLYRANVPGWIKPFVGLTGADGSSFRTNSANLNLATSQSVAMLCYASITTPGASANSSARLLNISDVDGLAFRNSNATDQPGALRPVVNGGAPTVPNIGTVDEGDITAVRQFVWYRNATTDKSGAYSDRSSATHTHSEVSRTGKPKGIGSMATTSSMDCRVCLLMIFLGANAEQNWPQYLATLRG